MYIWKSKRVRAVVLLGLLAVLAMVFWPRARVPPSEKPEPLKAAQKTETQTVFETEAQTDPKQKTHKQPAVDLRPLIEDVELEKKQVCPGESVKVTSRQKHDVKNPVRFTLPSYGVSGSETVISPRVPGVHPVHVVASDGIGGVDYKSVQLEVLKPDVPGCLNRPSLAVYAHLSRVANDTADVRVVPDPAFGKNVRYTYEFGDGSKLTTELSHVNHDYQLREQTEPMSSFIVKVTAEDDVGRSAVGRASVSLQNVHWLSTVVGSPMVPAVYDRFPVKRGSNYQTEVTFRNIEDKPISFQKVSVDIDDCSGAPRKTKVYSAEQVLGGLSGLAGSDSSHTTLALPADGLEGACRALVTVTGDTVPPRAGTPIGPGIARNFLPTRAEIALDIDGPPLKGAIAAAAPVSVNETMAAKLEQAKAILGAERPISPADITRLQREGRLR